MKEMKCRDVGLNCDFVAKGDNEEQVLKQVAVHAEKDHGMKEIPDEVLKKVKAAVHDA